jgi:hypothetical protein
MSNSNTYPKPSDYNCNTHFWNTATSEYWEVFTKKKYICPNPVNKSITVTDKSLDVENCTSEYKSTFYPIASKTTTTHTKPTYYSRKL